MVNVIEARARLDELHDAWEEDVWLEDAPDLATSKEIAALERELAQADPGRLPELFDEELDEAARARLLARGADIAPRLLQVVEGTWWYSTDSLGSARAPVHAARLLAELGHLEAIPAIEDILEEFLDEECIHHEAMMLALTRLVALDLEDQLEAALERGCPCVLFEAVLRAGARGPRVSQAVRAGLRIDGEQTTGILMNVGDEALLRLAVARLERMRFDPSDRPTLWEFYEIADMVLHMGIQLSPLLMGRYDLAKRERARALAALG